MGITKRYGGVYALKEASFSLRAGEVHALVGENGAGKSTLARILAGSTRADSGAISIHGARVEIATPLDAQRLGIGIIYQELDLFGNLTAGENIVIGNLHFPEGRLVSFRRMEELLQRQITIWGAGQDEHGSTIGVVEEPEGMNIPLKLPKKPKEKK